VRKGVVVIVAAISRYRAARDEARRRLGPFIEVYVHCPVEELVRRDTKGLYARALRAEVPHFTGINDPYEPPLSPEVTIYTHRESVDESVAKLLDAIELLPAAADLAAAF
jgi:adenylylsulfate kinase